MPAIIEIQAVQRGDETIVPESQISAADVLTPAIHPDVLWDQRSRSFRRSRDQWPRTGDQRLHPTDAAPNSLQDQRVTAQTAALN